MSSGSKARQKTYMCVCVGYKFDKCRYVCLRYRCQFVITRICIKWLEPVRQRSVKITRICIKWFGPVRQRSVKMMPTSRGSSDHNFNKLNLSFNIYCLTSQLPGKHNIDMNYVNRIYYGGKRWKQQHWSLAYGTCWLQTILKTFPANFVEIYSYIKRPPAKLAGIKCLRYIWMFFFLFI